MDVARSFLQAEAQLMKEFGEPLEREREGTTIELRGRRQTKERLYVLAHDADVQVGDVLRSVTSNVRFTVVDVDPHVVGSQVISIRAHYETATQQAQRLAAEQQRATVITIGTIQSSIINIQSQLDQAVQSIGALPDPTAKAELTQLVAQLKELLQQTPAEHAEQAEKVAKRVEAAVEEAAKPKPDHELVTFSLDSLQKAATNLATVLPTVLPVAMQIVDRIRLLIGG